MFYFFIYRDKSEVGTQTNFPPIAVFWDLENVQIPKHKSVADILRKIRNTLLTNYVKDDFFVVCDVSKEKNKNIIDTLVLCNCTVIHVTSLAKNDADYKLQNLVNKFSCRNIGGSVLIISSDVNFLWVLTEARYKYKNYIIMHKKNVNDTFLKVANESIDFDEFVCDLDTIQGTIPQNVSFEIEVKNLPNKKHSTLKKKTYKD